MSIIDWSEDWRDPLPPEMCLLCARHWTRCECDPDDPDMHRRIAIERALRAGDDVTAQALIDDSQIESAPAATEAQKVIRHEQPS